MGDFEGEGLEYDYLLFCLGCIPNTILEIFQLPTWTCFSFSSTLFQLRWIFRFYSLNFSALQGLLCGDHVMEFLALRNFSLFSPNPPVQHIKSQPDKPKSNLDCSMLQNGDYCGDHSPIMLHVLPCQQLCYNFIIRSYHFTSVFLHDVDNNVPIQNITWIFGHFDKIFIAF